MKVKQFFRILLIVLLVLVGIWCIIHRRVIYAWIKGEPMPELPEWHKKCVKWLLGKTVGEGAFYCFSKAISGKKKSDKGKSGCCGKCKAAA